MMRFVLDNDDQQVLINFACLNIKTLLAARITLNIDAGICATFSLENCVQYYLSMLDSVDKGDLTRAQHNQQMLANTCEQLQMDGNFFHSLKQRLNQELSSKGLQFGNARSPVWIPLKQSFSTTVPRHFCVPRNS